MKNGLAFFLGVLTGGLISGITTGLIIRSSMEKEHEERSKALVDHFDQERKALVDKYNTHALDKMVDEVFNKDKEDNSVAEEHTEPYVISNSEYGTKEGYMTTEVNIYTDGVIELGDDQKISISEAYDILGKENFKELALSDDTTIYVRNPVTSTDYRVEQLTEDYYDDDMDEVD